MPFSRVEQSYTNVCPHSYQLLQDRTNIDTAAAIRGLFPLELIPNMISLLAGKPNPQTFPCALAPSFFRSLVLNNRNGSSRICGD